MQPITIRNQGDERGGVTVPCGHCEKCVKRRQSAWSFRLLQEEKVCTSSIFLTLTYGTQKVPITKNGFMTLHKKDAQNFMKRLRKAHPNTARLKYYLVGEYGGKTYRPHFHMILFNADIKHIQPAWNQGQIHYGKVEAASVGYALKYMCKAKGSRIPLHRNDDRLPEFALMSKGLGLSYLTEKMIAWHHDDEDNRMYCNLTDGKKISMPRYFKQKIYSDEQRKKIGLATRARQEEKENKERANFSGDYDRYRATANWAAKERMHANATKGTTI